MLSVHLERAVETTASPDEVMALLREVEEHGRHHPNLYRVRPGPGPDTWEWRMEKMGAGPLALACTYGAHYTVDEGAGRVRWEPIEGDYNSVCRGGWTVTEGARTQLTLDCEFGLKVNVPRLVRGSVQRLLNDQYTRIVEGYTANLGKTLDGGDGRLR